MSSWILLQLMRLTYRLADVVIVNSEAAAEDVVKSLWLSRDRLEVIYNPIDLVRIAKLSREEISHPWLRPDGPPIVLGVGRLDPLKDFATLIRAFAIARLHRACRLVVLGEGEERAALEKLTRELRIQNHVYLPGFVANPFTWMNRAKVFVSSSLTESCPNALLEALACGAQVISTNCEGGCAEILDHGRWGRLTEVGDSDALGQAILAALETEQYPDGCRRVSDFAPERITRQYLEKLLPKGRHQLMGS